MNNLPENISPDLIAAYLSQQISPEDALLVETWVSASEGNRSQFEQYKLVWNETGKLVPAPIDVDVDVAWNRMNMQIDAAEQAATFRSENKKRIIPLQKYLLRIAAILIPIIAITSVMLWMNRSEKLLCQMSGEQLRTDTLSDGSVAHLNKHSKLTYPETFKDNTREVEMEGEIYFGIKPDKAKPFLIRAENTQIKVVGTSFNVKATKGEKTIEVLVETGKVIFSEINKNKDTLSISLVAGERGLYNKRTHLLTKQKAEDMNQLAWKSNTLVFNRTELEKVLSTLQEHYNQPIELKDKSLAKQHFSATFNNQSLDSILNVLGSTFELKPVKQEGGYILERSN